jgi:hypothetical protein
MKSLTKGSDNWNFIAKRKPLISKYLTWDVGNGQEALFWEDSWDGHPPLDKLGIPNSCKDSLTKLWGTKVSDYKTCIMTNVGIKWIWKSVDNLALDPTAKEVYKKIIHKRRIKQIDREDKLVWAASKEGRYSVKEGYKSIVNSHKWEEVDIPLNLCWDASCLPKAGFFLWLAYQEKILTVDRLLK